MWKDDQFSFSGCLQKGSFLFSVSLVTKDMALNCCMTAITFRFLLKKFYCFGFRRNSNVVHLRGLSFSAMESDVAAFFRGLELGPDGVVICVNFKGYLYSFSLFPICICSFKIWLDATCNLGRATGHAYVQFATSEIANKALEWDR